MPSIRMLAASGECNVGGGQGFVTPRGELSPAWPSVGILSECRSRGSNAGLRVIVSTSCNIVSI